MEVDIIVPVYFCDPSLYWTIEMFFSSLHACYPWFNVIGVDDCSLLDIPSHWPIVETNAINMGYTATVNKGLQESKGDLIIVANDDLLFHPGCLDRFFDMPNNMIASPADTASGDMEGFGAIFGMKRPTFERMGLMDDRYRNFFSDSAYLERAKSLGIEVVKWKDIIIQHPESSTFKVLGNKEELLAADQAIWNQ